MTESELGTTTEVESELGTATKVESELGIRQSQNLVDDKGRSELGRVRKVEYTKKVESELGTSTKVESELWRQR